MDKVKNIPNGNVSNVKSILDVMDDIFDEMVSQLVNKQEQKPKILAENIKKLEQVKEIAETKMQDLNAASLEAAMSMIKGTCRSMGITVEE